MSYYSTISDINDPNLSSQSDIHGITLPQKKSFSDKCLYQNLDIVAEMVNKCFRSEDYKEGRNAFMEKRKPNFD